MAGSEREGLLMDHFDVEDIIQICDSCGFHITCGDGCCQWCGADY